MKKLLSIIAAVIIFITLPNIGYASPSFAVPIQATTTSNPIAFPQKINGTYPGAQFPYYLATSTATSSFAGGINMTGGCYAQNGVCITAGGGSSSVGPVNTLQASNGAGGFIATGTPQLTVGNINATSTTASTTITSALIFGTSTNYLAIPTQNTYFDTYGNLIMKGSNPNGFNGQQGTLQQGSIILGDNEPVEWANNSWSCFYNLEHDNRGGEWQCGGSGSLSFTFGQNSQHNSNFQLNGATTYYGTIENHENGSSNRSIQDFSVANGGTGYVSGNVLTFVGGDNNATVTLNASELSGGVITNFNDQGHNLNGKGTSYSTGVVSFSGGSGTGATVNINKVTLDRPDDKLLFNSSYNNGGSNSVDEFMSNLVTASSTQAGLQTLSWYDQDPGFGSETANTGVGRLIGYQNASSTGANAFVASSTQFASVFPYASTTAITATTICLTGDICRTTWPSGGGGGVSTDHFSTSTTQSTTIYPNGGNTTAIAVGEQAITTNSLLEVVGTTTSKYLYANSSNTSVSNVAVGFTPTLGFWNDAAGSIRATTDGVNTAMQLTGGSVNLRNGGNTIVLNAANQQLTGATWTSTLSFLAQTGTPSFIPLKAQGAANQTADIFQAQNSSGVALVKVNNLGFLGVGTTTPWGFLSVASASSTTTPTFVVGTTTAGSAPQLIVTSNGNIGIGTSSPYATFTDISSSNSNVLEAVGTTTKILRYTDVKGNQYSAGDTPVATSCGTNPIIAVGSNNNAGRITIGSGIGTASCTLNFADGGWTATANAPQCSTDVEGGLTFSINSNPTQTAVVFAATTGTFPSDTFSYQCGGF